MATTSEHPPEESTQLPSETPQTALYEKLNTYPFDTDPEFAKGLSIILGHPDSPATREEANRDDDLVLQAKCFYFSRKEKLPTPLNVAAYKAWLRGENAGLRSADGSVGPLHADSCGPPAADQTRSQEPAYPSSFAHIVELITTGQPVPGIQEIPDTVLTGQDSASTEPKRRKPWEKEDSTGTTNDQ